MFSLSAAATSTKLVAGVSGDFSNGSRGEGAGATAATNTTTVSSAAERHRQVNVEVGGGAQAAAATYVSPFATNEAALAASALHRAEDLPPSSSSSDGDGGESRDEHGKVKNYSRRKGCSRRKGNGRRKGGGARGGGGVGKQVLQCSGGGARGGGGTHTDKQAQLCAAVISNDVRAGC